MRHLGKLSEAEMVAAFLRGEIVSDRFGPKILELLQRDGRNRPVVESPDLTNVAENAYRRQLLGDFRGYGQNRDHFENFPSEVSWHRYALSREELGRVRYIDYSYWNELSGGSRLPVDAARNVRGGKVVFGQTSERYWNLVRALERGVKFPEPIFVGTIPESPLVILEGHMRLTAYFLSPEHIPDQLVAIVGFSPGMAKWLALPAE